VTDVHLGIGRSSWTLDFWQIQDLLIVYFILEVLYFLAIGLVKISMCFLYGRLFMDTLFQRMIWATQVFNVLVVLSFVLLVLTQCQPLSYFWMAWDGEHDGTCINTQAVAYVHSAINIALDLWLLVLPATQIWNLRLTTKRKAAVTGMFAMGILFVYLLLFSVTAILYNLQRS
jgi:hypothetical protein